MQKISFSKKEKTHTKKMDQPVMIIASKMEERRDVG